MIDTTTSPYTPEEIEAHRKEWIAALRSGAYRQVKARLYDGEGYCCLGVAASLSGIEPVEEESFPHEEYDRWTFDGEPLTLPLAGMHWLGVENVNPSIDLPVEFRTTQGKRDSDDYVNPSMDVATLNDSGFTFNQIADLVEYFGLDPRP